MIQYASRGNWDKTRNWLNKVGKSKPKMSILRSYAQQGVEALKKNTPVSTGVTAESWYYEIVEERNGIFKIIWCNENLAEDWFNVALYLQLGHGTADGTWVEGIDYINPALAPVFNKLADEVWTEYTSNDE